MGRIGIDTRTQTIQPLAGRNIVDSINSLYGGLDGLVFHINSASDLPAAVDNAYTLPANSAFYFHGTVTLPDNHYIVCAGDVDIIGDSSESTFIVGNVAGGLIRTAYSLPLRFIALTNNNAGGECFTLTGDGVANAHDWFGVNFHGACKTGTITDISNFVIFSCAFFNSGAGITFNGSVGTVSMDSVLYSGPTTSIEVTDSAVITRRLRIIYSSLVVTNSNVGVNVSTSATIPVEGYILDSVNFSGGSANYIQGVQFSDDKAKFIECRGITNSASIGSLFIKNNATPTDIITAGERYVVAGTSDVSAINQRFDHDSANNALEYTSTIERVFKVTGTGTITGTQNNQIGLYIGVVRSGNAITPNTDRISESEVYVTASGTRPNSFAVQALVILNNGDKVYPIVQNVSADTDVTVNFINMIIQSEAN